MTIKITMFLQQSTAPSTPGAAIHRIGGWSESWYFPGVNVGNAIAAVNGGTLGTTLLKGLCAFRAALLPIGGAIVGQRFQVVDPPGLAQSTSLAFPGGPGGLTGLPQQALLVKVPGQGVRNIRRLILRAIPQVSVTEGEYTPAPGIQPGLLDFFFALGLNFNFRGRDLTQVLQPIISISVTGVITTLNAPAVAVGQFVRILKSKDSTGNLRGGRFPVTAISQAPNTVTVAGWSFGTTTGGNLRIDAVVYPAIDGPNIAIGRIITRRVGRPFIAFRGRRSRRR